ncbi:single-stranded DNA-binding protein [Pedobacter sp. MW01-1-1]|uniref:single-stranded DNA-binding protein n=1 Tax=Pedobacter sp. MW01-1-1 TaxID=3383027 RepID=UPI003FF06A51
MENSINKVVLTGYAGADVELKQLSGNLKLARVNLAVNEYYKNAIGEDVKKTQWVSLVFWNAKAELAAKIKKGSKVTIEGRLQTNSFEGKDGVRRYTTEIVVNDVSVKEEEIVN